MPAAVPAAPAAPAAPPVALAPPAAPAVLELPVAVGAAACCALANMGLKAKAAERVAASKDFVCMKKPPKKGERPMIADTFSCVCGFWRVVVRISNNKNLAAGFLSMQMYGMTQCALRQKISNKTYICQTGLARGAVSRVSLKCRKNLSYLLLRLPHGDAPRLQVF